MAMGKTTPKCFHRSFPKMQVFHRHRRSLGGTCKISVSWLVKYMIETETIKQNKCVTN